MNFDLSDDQRMIVDAAAAFAKKQSPISRMRALREDALGYAPAIWRQMAELGWLGLVFPEAAGGAGAGLVEAALVVEQLAATLVPEPIVSSIVAGSAIVIAGDADQQRRFLAPVVDGRGSLALAWAEQRGFEPTRIATRAEPAADGRHRITGTKRFVLDGHAAAQLVVSAHTGDRLALFVVDRDAPGVTVRPLQTLDGRRAAHVELAGAEVPADRCLEGDGAAALAHALDIGAALTCAEGVGVMRTVLAMTLDYLRTREQFGVAIGTFQVLQHRAVDMFVETELAYSAMLAAVIRGDARSISAAKIQLAESGRLVTQQAIQLHGGIGITDEHDVGLFFKRMHVLATTYGDAEYHVARYPL